MTRSHRLEFPRVDAPRIKVHGDLFAPIILNQCARHGHDTSVEVVSPQPEAATRALDRAADRFGRVTHDGRELATDRRTSCRGTDRGRDWDEYYSPNYVSSVTVDGGHPSPWMDWKDTMAPAMARTMIHILIDELLSDGVQAATIRPRPKIAD